MGEEELDIYDKALLEKLDDVKRGLTYYIHRTHGLESELEVLQDAYQSRVNAYIELEKRTRMLENQLELELKKE